MRTQRLVIGLVALQLLIRVGTPSSAQQVPTTAAPTANVTSAGGLASKAHELAKVATSLEELTEALRVCGQALKADPSPEAKAYVHQLASWTYNKRGEKLVELADRTASLDAKRAEGYEKAALKDFQLAVRLNGNSWKARFNRAVSLAMVGEYEEALIDLNFVIEQNAEHRNARFNRAEILSQLGELEAAVQDYAAVIEADPKDAAAFSGRGLARAHLGRIDEAMLDLNTVVRLEPENAKAYVDRADVHAASGNWERAAGDYRVAIGLDNELGRAYHNVAWMMATCPEERFRNPQLSVQAAKRAIKLDGRTYRNLDTLAAALASAGDFDRADAVLKQALPLAPEAERQELQGRLALYQQRQPYREDAIESHVELASAEEPLEK